MALARYEKEEKGKDKVAELSKRISKLCKYGAHHGNSTMTTTERKKYGTYLQKWYKAALIGYGPSFECDVIVIGAF